MAAGVPVLGVCLGGQVMTLACGGVVDRAPVAEVGVYEIELTEDAENDPLFSVLPQGVPVAQYHGDAMLEAPEGAVLLGQHPRLPDPGLPPRRPAWAVQFHPEVDAEILGSWFADDPAPVEKCGRTTEAVLDRDGRPVRGDARRLAAVRPRVRRRRARIRRHAAA